MVELPRQGYVHDRRRRDCQRAAHSADSPEGTTVEFVNQNEVEQELYPIDLVTLDETGYYEFDSFRRGDYLVKVRHEGYVDIDTIVSIWEPMDLRFVMIEIIYSVSDLYVSRTGWAMWDAQGMPTGGQAGEPFTFGFEEDPIANGWTIQSLNATTWVREQTTQFGAVPHEGQYQMWLHWAYGDQDEWLITPEFVVPSSGNLQFWHYGQEGSTYGDHYYVKISTDGGNTWTELWDASAQPNAENHYTSAVNLDLSSYAGQNAKLAWQGYAIDGLWYAWCVDDITVSGGREVITFDGREWLRQPVVATEPTGTLQFAKDGSKSGSSERHLEHFKVMCTSIDGEPIFNTNVPADQPFFQLNTDELVEGEQYICKVAAMYSTGMSDWMEATWEYESCEHYAPIESLEVTPEEEGNYLVWEFACGGITPPGQGDEFTVDFEAGLPAGWNVIDANNDSYTWTLTSNIPTAWPYYASLTLDWYHSGSNAICSGSYINGVGAITPDEYLVTEQVNLVNGSTFSFYAAATDAGYPADHFGVFVSDNGTSNWEMVNEWTLTAKGGDKGDARASRDGNGLRLGTWHTYSVDLSAYAGQQKYIAIRHFNCSDQYIMCVDDIELTTGAKANRNPWDLMMTFSAPEGGHYGVAYDGNNFYTSNWGYSSAAYNFYKYDLDGNMLEGFNISGCGTLRGITYDGTYFYGVANSSTVYCVDLANHSVVSTFTSAYGAMRGITYDPERDGFWVIGNWSGNLTLINRQGAIVTTGPAPESASDLAYYKDENDVEHVFCFNNGTNDVVDWVIGNATMGSSVFNFSSTPGFASGASSGGCTVGSFNGKIAFIGDLQQSPNLIGVYELREDNTTPVPVPTGDIIGFMIFRDGQWLAQVGPEVRDYTDIDEFGEHEYCVRVIYNGTAELPSNNFYYAMSCPVCEGDRCAAGEPIYGEVFRSFDQVRIWWGENAAIEGVVKYNVYRSTDNVTYSMIGEVIAVEGQVKYEYIDTPERSAGTYYYQVRADYGYCESEPAISGEDPTANYVVISVTSVDENEGFAIFPNPTKANVTIQAKDMQHITVVSVLGQVVYDADVDTDEVILNMSQYAAGMYTVRVMTENGVRVERVSVVR